MPPDTPAAVPGPGSYAEAVRLATPSVVNIYTAKLVTARRNPMLDDRYFRRFSQPQAQRQRIERSLGSGVIMTAQGHILTNNHVIEGASEIHDLGVCTFDGFDILVRAYNQELSILNGKRLYPRLAFVDRVDFPIGVDVLSLTSLRPCNAN